MKINIYASCGLWKSSMNNGWGFLVDEEKGGKLLTLDTSSSFENLKVMVCEDFGIDVNMVNIELSYLPSDLINSINSPPVIITSDRQVRNFLTYVKNKASTQLCVSTQAPNIAEEGTESPTERKSLWSLTIQVIWSLTMQLIWIQKKILRYLTVKMTKSVTKRRSMKIVFASFGGCCEESSVRTVSANTVATLIMHKYETAKEGPRQNDIIQYMRMVHGVEISYSLAWDAREYAINAVKGIPEKGYEQILKYLHMTKEANPGTLSFKHSKPLTIVVEKMIDRRIEKGKTFKVFPVSDHRHTIKAGFSVGTRTHTLTDDMYTTASWRSAYEESINPISVPKDAWKVPSHVEKSKILPPESRRAAGRRKKRRYETAEDKICSSQGTQGSKVQKCSRCGIEGHNRRTCDRAI
ncbi:hypothetical protein F2Q68_00024555 [Brassica cretica]|uniref:CCHC-type domain-containing protein n=1 Tax=Brassica cretica TaxID=69181 RepID=A0A8S9I7G5_BRACR|nr:hypothetical protein F2Q68_00024555 [Brassica cretica]